MINKIKDIYLSLEKLWNSIEKDEKNYLLGGAIIISLFGLSIIFILPWLFTRTSISLDDYKDLGGIGDTINGIAGPFIALLAAILTFLAFYVQFKANKLQREQFTTQINNEKEKFRVEIEEQRNNQRLTQFESQFYEMLRLHKENVNEIFINFIEYRSDSTRNSENSVDTMIYGRKVFDYYLNELEVIYEISKNDLSNFRDSDRFMIVYSVFYHGINHLISKNIIDTTNDDITVFLNNISMIKEEHKNKKYKILSSLEFSTYINKSRSFFESKFNFDLNYSLFEGYSSFLGHYFRHLYQTVKFVSSKSFLSYEDKRNYLRILRSQLSNQEQVLLYYNWKAGFGKNWENESNHFFTDYRMIHNIFPDMLFSDLDLKNSFNLSVEPKKKEEFRVFDPLFEFQKQSKPNIIL